MRLSGPALPWEPTPEGTSFDSDPAPSAVAGTPR